MKRFKLLLFILAVSLSHTAQAFETLTFSSAQSLVYTSTKTIISEVYRRIGYDTEVIQLPAERALKLSNSGEVDGELFRIHGLQKYYPNLREIPTPIGELKALAVSINLDVKITSWEDLKPYTVGIITGIKYSEHGTKGLDVYGVTSYKQLFNMLLKNRVDIVICTRLTCLYELKKLKIETVKSLGVVQTIPLHHYLHSKHEALIPLVNAQIINMKKEGALDKIHNDSSAAILEGANF